MTTYRSFKEVRASYRRKAKKINSMQSVAKASRIIHKIQRKHAPRRTGETIAKHINRRISQHEQHIISDVTPKGSKGFKQNMWANRTEPHKRVRMRWNKLRPTLYGQGSKAHWTGTPRWFSIGAVAGRTLFPRLVIKEFRQIVKSK